jgi:2-polyprenyl-6-methoxyphenol hydroxylase-like FAD-dependent oxidoreductase
VATRRNIAVVGAGIGGLCAAIGLRQAGHEVRVFERAPSIEPVGAGLSLWPNARHALEKLGLDSKLAAVSIPTTSGAIRSPDGSTITPPLPGGIMEIFGSHAYIVHRADLQNILLDAAGEGTVRLGHQLNGFSQDANGVRLRFANRPEETAEILIGADGIQSIVREALVPGSKPRYEGHTAWRGITEFRPEWLASGSVFETWGQGRLFGMTQIDEKRVYWFATKKAPEGERDDPDTKKVEILELFQNWHDPISKVILSTEPQAIIRSDIYDIAPLKQWAFGRVALLGDAAHAMFPNLGQGGCQSIEDAVVLAEALVGDAPIEPALKTYESRRIARTTMIQKRSRQVARVAHFDNPLLCAIRNFVARHAPASATVNQMKPVIAHKV